MHFLKTVFLKHFIFPKISLKFFNELMLNIQNETLRNRGVIFILLFTNKYNNQQFGDVRQKAVVFKQRRLLDS